LLVIFPKLILPLFNKLSPLPEGELRDTLVALAERCGFVAQKIEIIDGSKRSGHSNAYFTGFGKWRRIVLFDTLVEQLSPKEIEVVLAHEIGHSKCGHITKRLVVSSVIGLALLGFVGWLLNQKVFFTAFGFEFVPGLMLVPAFLLLSQIVPLITFWISPVSAYFSRKHEYEADAFAKEITGTPDTLIAALHKLHEKNLSNLTPHPLYSAFFYSHPTLAEREKALKKALDYVSKALKTKRQVKEYLQGKEFSEEIVYNVLDKLIEYGLINDYNYCLRYIETYSKTQGRKLMEYKLMLKGISKTDIEKAFMEIDGEIDNVENVYNLAVKHLKGKERTLENYSKTYRYLASKGYLFEDIDKAMYRIKGED
jgi:Zn-dependent protease with chaperone function